MDTGVVSVFVSGNLNIWTEAVTAAEILDDLECLAQPPAGLHRDGESYVVKTA